MLSKNESCVGDFNVKIRKHSRRPEQNQKSRGKRLYYFFKRELRKKRFLLDQNIQTHLHNKINQFKSISGISHKIKIINKTQSTLINFARMK